jgi:hypothetical protein
LGSTRGSIAINIVVTGWQCLTHEVVERSGDTIGSQHSNYEQLLEEHVVEFLPVHRKLAVLWGELVIPILELGGQLIHYIVSKLLEELQLNQFLHGKPGEVRQPLFERVGYVSLDWAL